MGSCCAVKFTNTSHSIILLTDQAGLLGFGPGRPQASGFRPTIVWHIYAWNIYVHSVDGLCACATHAELRSSYEDVFSGNPAIVFI